MFAKLIEAATNTLPLIMKAQCGAFIATYLATIIWAILPQYFGWLGYVLAILLGFALFLAAMGLGWRASLQHTQEFGPFQLIFAEREIKVSLSLLGIGFGGVGFIIYLALPWGFALLTSLICYGGMLFIFTKSCETTKTNEQIKLHTPKPVYE